MSDSVLVTGGAGYIGSHTARRLVEAGRAVVVLDNLYSGHPWAVPAGAEFVRGDIADAELLRRLFDERGIGAVVHFAAHVEVPESVADPLKYYRNNVAGSLRLIEACLAGGVERFVFSSSAAVYGVPDRLPVGEDAPVSPINPYGWSKAMTERMLVDVSASRDPSPLCHVALRYFNVAGASLDGVLGQATPNATHLIKVACEAACGRRDAVRVFGADYPTQDGTGVRDYVHVLDLAEAHVAALDHLDAGGASQVLNCGYGRGYSVLEVIETVRRISGVDFPVVQAPRRPGDPPALVADATRIRGVLGWAPRHDDLEQICRSAYLWELEGMSRMQGTGGKGATG
jgi:UDP-glucose 4-epimerase